MLGNTNLSLEAHPECSLVTEALHQAKQLYGNCASHVSVVMCQCWDRNSVHMLVQVLEDLILTTAVWLNNGLLFHN